VFNVEPGRDGRATDARLGLAWLVRVRYGAVALFACTLFVCRFGLGLEVDYAWIAALLGLTLVSNLVLSSQQARAPKVVLPFVLGLDVTTLAVSLALSGGAANPFSVFFLVHVALAAVLLRPALSWLFVMLTSISFGTLFALPAPGHEHHAHGAAFSAHLAGMWIAYALSAAFVAYFVGTVSRAVRKLDREAAELRILSLQNERLATLTSFSATAAHELASPLSTIALAAEELEVSAGKLLDGARLDEDIQLIRREIRRSRDILTELSSRAGESMGEMPMSTTPADLVDGVLSQLSPRLARQLEVEFENEAARQLSIVTTKQTVIYLLHSLLRNAFEAEEEAQVAGGVRLVVDLDRLLRFRVLDRGRGIRADVLPHIGEPFVTTKGERGGLGLGLFLARAFAERVGGVFALRTRSGGGTEVEFSLPELTLERVLVTETT
jgi:two-component system sensor histidine kinase RegB